MKYTNKEKKALYLALFDTFKTRRRNDYSRRQMKLIKLYLKSKNFEKASRKDREILRHTLIDTLVNSDTPFTKFQTYAMTDLYHKIGSENRKTDWRREK